MADYIYLLENRLSQPQQSALLAIREIARSRGVTVFLVGGAVRDLTTGSPVRDLDVAVQGNALKLRKDLEKAGAQISGEHEPSQALYVRFPGNVRMEVSSTLSIHFPKPGKPVSHPASILEDLRRRDFTANAMALSLNEGSYGLLMDPLNGVADIENRELRLVSNYGFIEDPVRMIRAARLSARLGWQMEERTLARYETGKTEGYISALSEFQRGYELEEIVHEEDPLRVLRRLESEGWMKVLCAAWLPAKANIPELEKLREAQGQLQIQGIQADASAAHFPLLTAKMAPKDVAALLKSFPRTGFIAEIEAVESEAKAFAAELSSRQAATPSASWKMIFAAPPEVVLWVAYSTRSAALQAKFKSFYTQWPQARQRIPYVLMQEMRIVPELPGYNELVEQLFFALMDGQLETPEQMKAFLEPHSPPAPPPPVSVRRPRAAKTVRVPKSRKKAEVEAGADTPLDVMAAEIVIETVDALGASPSGREESQRGPAQQPAPAAVAVKQRSKSEPSPAPAKTAPGKKAAPAAHDAVAKASSKASPKVRVPAPAAKKHESPARPNSSAKTAHKAAPAKKALGKSASVTSHASRSGKLAHKPAKKPASPSKHKPAAKPPKAHAKPAAKPVSKSSSGKPPSKAPGKSAKTPAPKPTPKKPAKRR